MFYIHVSKILFGTVLAPLTPIFIIIACKKGSGEISETLEFTE